MEKLDIAIAVTGAVVLVVAIGGSAFFGGAGGLTDFDVTFPTSDTALDSQTTQVQGSGEFDATFPVATANVTQATFTATVTAPAGAAAPSVRIIVTTPEGDEFTADESTLTVTLTEAPDAFKASAADAGSVALPAASTTAVGDWSVIVQVTSPAPLPVPYTVEIDGTVTAYAADVRLDLPPPAR